jgi:two-component system cell cycle response regulator DivK
MAKVLVIEDDPLNMKLAILVLGHAGHVVMCAENAEQGLLMATADQPDIILMDWELPGISGTEATVRLKQNPHTASIPVIACTASLIAANRASSDSLTGHAMGFTAYIQKPFRYQELDSVISAVLTKHTPATAKLLTSTSTLAGTPTGTTPIVDVAILERLIGNDREVICRFLSEFQISAALTGQAIALACATRQPVIASREAHKLKSTAHMAGATSLGMLCGEIELAGNHKQCDELSRRLPELEQTLQAVNAFLLTFLRQETTG